MENLGEKMEKEEIECLINEIDIDGKLDSKSQHTYDYRYYSCFLGDGQINYEEFYTMMCTK